LWALDLENLTPRWTAATGGRVRSTPKVHDTSVYFGSWDHHLYALDVKSGRKIWRFDTGGVVQASPAISAYPSYFEGVTLERGLHAVDSETGKPRWVVPTGALPGYVTGGVMSTPRRENGDGCGASGLAAGDW
jgi:outer membrane protein assembly factor BamB